MQHKIVFLDAKSLGNNNLGQYLSEFGEYTEYEITSPNETLQRCNDATIIITNKVILDSNILESLKDSLKLICITATGTNNVDLQTAQKLGIEVKNVVGYSTKSVAQHTLMMALALSAKIPYYDDYCKSKKYAQNPLFTNLDEKLELINGKNWGIIGLGTIGLEVARLANAFGAYISYYSTSGNNNNPDFQQKDLDTLLKESSIISIHAPLNEKTKNLLNKDNLDLIHEGAILINVGRGGIINENDLAETLKVKKFYAGLDVFESEPPKEDNPLFSKEIANQLLLTPHNAWGYENSKKKLIKGILDNIKEFLRLD
ncbi:D-2-hydroxyacid dehydrogenase [Helicobacter ibis]|uniref:D-2-hydroxyacid dehydrogenase n=1 Tax=Helicobacter ibis TaxID=2962633 RepID=A0ABT4VBN0_9HELI|nr:D-2-hydroxyacid dehydrogenase [Helicobacter ibis]MDA3968116.1 D-2-hydroxyacid dehydrogenase [Helicobacter ibis]